jgi:hypothetical protein
MYHELSNLMLSDYFVLGCSDSCNWPQIGKRLLLLFLYTVFCWKFGIHASICLYFYLSMKQEIDLMWKINWFSYLSHLTLVGIVWISKSLIGIYMLQMLGSGNILTCFLRYVPINRYIVTATDNNIPMILKIWLTSLLIYLSGLQACWVASKRRKWISDMHSYRFRSCSWQGWKTITK